MPPKSLPSAYLEHEPLRSERSVIDETCTYLLLGAGLLVSIGGIILLAGGWPFWVILIVLIAVPKLAEIALVMALLFSAVLLIPGADEAAILQPLARHWPLALAVLVPMPLAMVIDRAFFRS